MAVDAAAVATWGRFAVPTGTELTLLTSTIAAATAKLSRDYYLDDPTTADQDLAIMLDSGNVEILLKGATLSEETSLSRSLLQTSMSTLC